MTIKTFRTALVVGSLSLVSVVSPASAASPSTRAFMETVAPNVDFLDQSSRLALTNTRDARIKAFARDEAKEQTLAANSLYDWSNQPTSTETTKVAAGEPALQTGRSVAVDTPANAVVANVPLGQEELDALYGLTGKEFDTLYKQNQLEALAQVRHDYETYLASGDDPALKAMAARELPKVKQRLDLLGKL